MLFQDHEFVKKKRNEQSKKKKAIIVEFSDY